MRLPRQIGSLLTKRVPVLEWLPKYNKQDAISDFIAGITVGLTLMPQAIAYAALAGLDPQYGLYSGCAGILMYVVFGSTKQITIGPTALLSLLTYNYTHEIVGKAHRLEMVVIFTLFTGIIELLCGILHLGFLVNFVSSPVISGFTSAAAMIIASAQMKNLFGLSYNGETFLEIWRNFFKHKSETKLNDVVLGITCIAILSVMKKMNTLKCVSKDSKKSSLQRVVWILSTGRNALVVVSCASLSYYFKNSLGITPFTLTGNIVSGMPSVQLPPTTTVLDDKEANIIDMISYLGSALLVAPLISVISNLALAKAFSNGGQVDASQEMIALGMCNIIGSLVQSMPTCGAFSRSAVNTASGVRTTFGCVYTSLLVLLTLSFLTPYFYYIPRASLAAVIMAAVLLMIDIDIIIKSIWSIHKFDLLPGVITFAFCLLIGVEYGLIIGIIFDILRILYYTIRPTVIVEKIDVSNGNSFYWHVKIPNDVMLFPAIDHIRNVLFKKTAAKGEKQDLAKTVVIDGLHMMKIDFSAVQGLNSLMKDLSGSNAQLVLLIRDNHGLVLSVSRLSPDMKVVSSIEELESYIYTTNGLDNIGLSTVSIIGLNSKCQEANCGKYSINLATEDTKC